MPVMGERKTVVYQEPTKREQGAYLGAKRIRRY